MNCRSGASKWIYLHVVQGDYGQGWEDLTQSESRKEMCSDLRAYRENCPDYAHRMIRRREIRPIPQED